MKKIILTLTLLVISSSVFAWTIGPMNYQGRLLDNAGIPVTGSYNFKVRIYDAASGGTLKFSEDQNSIAVDDGVYSFLVSTGTNSTGAWDIALWNTPQLYLEIEVNGETLSPRHLMAAAPYAFQANLALTTNNALALGGKSATEYQNILASICESSKGKWLELVEKCLGIGASFPGPTLVSYTDLTEDGDFSNLDLSGADISGIQFDDATMTSTIFKGTTYSVEGMSGANLRDTVWEGAMATDQTSYQVTSTTNLSGATLKNMDLSQWDLTQLTQTKMDGLSAAALTGCPPGGGLPSGWECRNDGVGVGGQPSVLSFLAGPGVNLSANSAAAYSKFGSSYLNLASHVLNDIDLTGATFEGNVVSQNFTNTTLDGVRFDYTTLRSNVFTNCSLIGAQFNGSKLDKPSFFPDNIVQDNMFTDAELNFVYFEGEVTGAQFNKATLTKVSFGGGVSNSIFSGAVLNGVRISGDTGNNTFTYTAFYNGFTHGTVPSVGNPYTGGSTFEHLAFIDGTLSGDFTGAVFTDSILFENIKFEKIDLCAASIPLTGSNPPYPEFSTSIWTYNNVICPSGENGAGGGCGASSTYMTPTAVQNCAPGAGTFGP